MNRHLAILALATFLAMGFRALGADDAPQKGDPHWLLPVPEMSADPEIPPVKSVLRYGWGEEISSHHQIETYLKALAKAAPNRTRLFEYGRSYEGRSLNYLVISSSENVSRLESIRRNNLRLADPRVTSEAQRTEIIAQEKMPSIVWLAYCVHGNEVSPSDAALLTAYHLLADERPETQELLKRLVVIIDPLQNPDGRDRFVNVFRETRGRYLQKNPFANEHTERWPSGRSNHYWFDMNRDWFRHSQKEVQAKVAAYVRWHPQIYVDAHEMGHNRTFYFPPAADPKNPYLLTTQHDWFSKLGKHQAGWFDRYGFGYMTREVFDAFYPGYGSEWPTMQGGLGVLWEQASARGLAITRADETDLTYADGIRNHYISGIATLEFAAAHREELLHGFYQSRQRGIQLGSEGTARHFFLLGDRPQRSRTLATVLRQNGIEVRRLSEPVDVLCTDTKDNSERQRTIPAGSYHVPGAQPAGTLLRALMDRSVEMDHKFLRRQLERNQLRLPDEIYDVTAWSLPLAFDVTCLACGRDIAIQSTLWSPEMTAAPRDFAPAKVAYLIRGTDGAILFLSKLIQQGIRVHVSDRAFTINGQDFDRGTLIVKVSENDETLYETLKHVSRETGVQVAATDTAYVDRGAHIGGPDVRWVRPPKVLLVVNTPTYYSSGHTWHLFDHALAYPTSRMDATHFLGAGLRPFNTIVLPDGGYDSELGFAKELSEKLLTWVQEGGTLILLRGATQWAAGKENELLKNKIVRRKITDPNAAKLSAKNDSKQDASNDDSGKDVPPDHAPGSFLRANVFLKHWITYGYKESIDVFYSGRLILSPTAETDGRSLVTFAARDRLLTSGFCWPANLELLSETPYVVYRRVGKGQVVAFTDDPNFRAMYPSLQRLFINAAMFGAAHRLD